MGRDIKRFGAVSQQSPTLVHVSVRCSDLVIATHV
jgi:hypothetical protein